MPVHHTSWRKSRHSDPNGECLEVRRAADGTVSVRDTKQHGHGPILEFTQAEWKAFLGYIRNHTHYD
ncbi:hypothetical protein Acsp03_61820 [Actinomadura sp. NBRC 104412]|uniref:DUF397 domain-containing protein n=1 Tax=Actinomadura sp. NBRC 104412 TaxID=3032203 RepID=UPI0024A26697|nr:DUF397 domain-containing protein [Actinomadura sp. NBRC 104412]GLZ08716.1 hypothetical protein Acsp03_61820 [Actinomadura sp. NBRC 104412]